MTLSAISILLLGWLLGLLSPAIVEVIRSQRESIIIKNALFTELQELQYRLLLVVYRIESKYGKIDKLFFEWAQSILIKYKGINSSSSLLDTIGPLLKMTDEEMEVYANYTKGQSQPNSGLELKKYSFSLLDSNLLLLSKFDPILQGHLLEIKNHIGFINESVDDSRYYFRLSFQNGISSVNYELANTNMINSCISYSKQARVVIELISKILVEK